MTDKLGELENLLEQQESSNTLDVNKAHNNIVPVLDELVTEEDYLETGESPIIEETIEPSNE